ncbi:MAG: ABC-F family ATP-binding cassette domain-containing protein, partial [Acidobacteriota bacterium]|nr:ABC-F family ATP-binding cassette domain-containing protein [Acidobacteriota bacterium]
DGGYAAYVLARAERDRQEAVREDRRQQLLRKELAWLRRGPPARTTKPKFRIEAANALIAGEPEPRDTAELLRFATARLGDKVINAIDVSLVLGGRRLLHDLTWRIGPGDRVAIVGVNGSGKSSLLRLLAGELEPTSGRVEHGATVRLAHLSQDTAELPFGVRVRAALEEVRRHAVLSDGREITAGMLCERFGFRGAKAHTPVEDLSGGERRRLSLMRLLMAEPNVLLLDEPTNDLDIDTLTALEDLLDGWPGTLIAVSHDRYFVERVCDNVYAVSPAGGIDHLPGGIDQYIEGRGRVDRPEASRPARAVPQDGQDGLPPGARIRETRKRVQRLQRDLRRAEREIERLAAREAQLDEQMTASATDHARLLELHSQLEETVAARGLQEASWLELSEALEGAEAS